MCPFVILEYTNPGYRPKPFVAISVNCNRIDIVARQGKINPAKEAEELSQ